MAFFSQDMLLAASTGIDQCPLSTTLEVERTTLGHSANTMTQLAFDIFHPFPQLPVELRLKIWNCALPGSRVVEIEWCEDCEQWFCPRESQPIISGLFRACVESRCEFLKEYSLFLKQGNSRKRGEVQCQDDFSNAPISYFNPQIDILYIGPIPKVYAVNETSLETLNSINFLSSLRTVAFNNTEWSDMCKDWDVDFLSQFSSLQKFVSVVGDYPFIGGSTGGNKHPGEIVLIPVEEERERRCEDTQQNQIDFTLMLDKNIANGRPARELELRVMQVQRGGVIMDLV